MFREVGFWANRRARFHYRVAGIWTRLQRYGLAADAYRKVLHSWPEDRQAQFYRAWCLLQVPARRPEGIVEFQTLIEASPSGSAYYLMACGLQQEQRLDEAVLAFHESLRLEDAGAAEVHINLADCLWDLSRFSEAADEYQNAAHLNPSDANGWSCLGAAYAELGRWKEAAPCFERAWRLAPNLQNGVDFVDTLFELNRLDEAERVVRDTCALNGKSIEARNRLALVLSGLDRYDEALEIARATCAHAPDDVSSRCILAVVLSEAGDLKAALKEAQAALEVAPTDTQSHLALGSVYVKMHDGAGALAAFERAAEGLTAFGDRPMRAARSACAAGRAAALSLLARHDEAVAAFDALLHDDPTLFERWPEVMPHYERSLRVGSRHRVDR